MIDLKARLSGDKSVRHDDSRVQEIQSSVATLSDITALRVYIPRFPYGVIQYSADDNYRKSGTDPNCESIVELGRGIQSSGLQQSIGLFAPDLSAEQLKSLANNNDSSNQEVWNTAIKVVFGNRRYLAITHHTNLTHESVYIYPREAASFIKDIALIENMDRENVDLVEESVALYHQINHGHSGNVAGFARFSGRPITILNKIYKIGQAADANVEFQNVIQKCESKDVIALEYIAKAVLNADTPYRQSQVKKKLEELRDIDGKIVDFRKKAKDLSTYAKGESNKKPNWGEQEKSIESVTKDSELNPISESTPNLSENTASDVPVKRVDLNGAIKKIGAVTNLLKGISPQDYNDQLRSQLAELKTILIDSGI